MKKTIVCVALVAILNGSTPAQACCGDGKIAGIAAESAGAKVVGIVEVSTEVLRAWLERLNTTIAASMGSMTAAFMKSGAAIRILSEGSVAVQSQDYMDRVRATAQVTLEPSPRACYELAGAAAGVTSAGEVTTAMNRLSESFTQRTLFTPNNAAVVAKSFADHAEKYCSQKDADLGRCARAANPSFQDADVRADFTLNTASYTPEQAEAARAYVNNLTNPIPTQNIPLTLERTDQGKTFVAGQYIEQARASVAANALNAAIAGRIPVKGLGTAAMVDKADISEQELIESQVRGRFSSTNWYAMVAGFGLDNMARELVKMRALQNWMDLKSYRQGERIESIVATQLAIDVKNDSEPRLREARRIAGGKQ